MACQNISFNLNNNRLSIVLWILSIVYIHLGLSLHSAVLQHLSAHQNWQAPWWMVALLAAVGKKKFIYWKRKANKQTNMYVLRKKKQKQEAMKESPLIQRIEKYPQDNKQNVICSGTFFFFIFYFLLLLLYPKTLIFVSSTSALGFSKKHDPQPPIPWLHYLVQAFAPADKPTSAKAVLAFMLNSTQYK